MPMMTADDYRKALAALNLPQTAAAHFFDVNTRTSRRWADADPENPNNVPKAVEMVLKIMLAKGLSVDEVRRIVAQDIPET